MVKDVEKRISTMETKFDLILPYLEEGRKWRDKTTETLTVVVNNQVDFKEYQNKCDSDRSSMDKRITANEGFQGRQVKAAAIGGGIMGFLVIGGYKVVDKVMGLFS